MSETAQAERYYGKRAAAFRTTGEAAEALDVPAHVLRFWESKFPQLKPLKRGGGRRYYRPEDIDLLRRIRHHLYQEGYTIRGVQKLLREGTLSHRPPTAVRAPARHLPPAAGRAAAREAVRATLAAVRRELLQIRALLGETQGGGSNG